MNKSMVCMIRQVFKLKNVRRAPGSQGLFRFNTHFHETDIPTYLSSTGTSSFFVAFRSVTLHLLRKLADSLE